MHIAERLAAFAAGLRFEDIPAAVRERAKYLILDAVGIALASGRRDFAAIALRAFREFEPGGGTVIGMRERLALRDAAVMNGLLVHGIDFDDTHIEGVVHITASCFPCAFGVAAQLGATGADLLRAYILAVEVNARLGAVAKGGFHEVGLHPTGIVAPYGCALAAGVLHGLDCERLVMAQGVALSTAASSSRQFNLEGAWTKRLHPGWAAAAGITAALLAKHGFVGPRAVYEGEYGLYRAHLGPLIAKCDLDLATAGLGRVWETANVAVKPIPACHLVHACSDAAAIIARDHDLRAADIASVVALVPKEAVRVVCEPVARRRRPATEYAAQFSIHYAVACGLLHRRFTLHELTASAYTDPVALALADRVEYGIDPEAEYPRYFPGAVIVKTTDGRELRHRERINRGAADRPISAADIEAKYRDNAALAVPAGRAERIRDAVLALDRAPHAGALAAALAAAD